MSNRRPGGQLTDARERALHLLYEAEMKGVAPTAVLASQVVDPAALTKEIVEGVTRDRASLHESISEHLVGWTIERLSVIDRIVLEIGTFELRSRSETPRAVILSEAVELAKRFSTAESGRFVNGVLAAIARSLGE